ncbi:MAG TPA: hypothetical protein VGQ39_13675 [Pyrinomonadaceae bacterium]|nr:hypothetical protein [Pyrinomonadaceae bacterium]
MIGASSGNISARPQAILGDYDIVFAKARCALEALAVGSAVILCDTVGVGPMVTTRELDQLRRLNFGVRTLRGTIDADGLEKEIARYDPEDAAEVSRRIRTSAGREGAIDQIIEVYRNIIRAFEMTTRDQDSEARAEAFYLQQLAQHFEEERNFLLTRDRFGLRKRLRNLPLAGRLLRSLARKF